ncbi:MAG: DUF4105 domain-containing protein [Alloprevotella sp.]
MRKYGVLILAMLVFSLRLSAEGQVALPTDLHAYLLVVEPGNDLTSAYGHAAFRLTCPSKSLDNCFTYGMEDTFANNIRFFTGTGQGRFVAVKSAAYIDNYKAQGRGMMSYKLNLTLEQIRNLWKTLDREVAHGSHRHYDYMHTNCSSMCAYMLELSLGADSIRYRDVDEELTGTYRTSIHAISDNRPWTDLFWQTLVGAEGDGNGQLWEKLSPKYIARVWAKAELTDSTGQARPLLAGSGQQVLSHRLPPAGTWFTPVVCMSLLLAVALSLALAERRRGRVRAARLFDIGLACCYTALGIVMVYTSFFSELSSFSMNRLAIVYNPLPALLWCCFRKRGGYRRLYPLYATVLVAFMAIAPWMTEVGIAHLLFMLTLLVRVLVWNRQRV